MGFSLKNTISQFSINFIPQESSDKISKVITEFALSISQIFNVKKIAYKTEGNVITIQTYIKEPNEEILFKIYALEQKIIEKFPELILDFNVIFENEKILSGLLKFLFQI